MKKKYNVRFYVDYEVTGENREEAYIKAEDCLNSEIEAGCFPSMLSEMTEIAEGQKEYTFETTGNFTVKASNYEEAKAKFWEEICKLPNSEFDLLAGYRKEE